MLPHLQGITSPSKVYVISFHYLKLIQVSTMSGLWHTFVLQTADTLLCSSKITPGIPLKLPCIYRFQPLTAHVAAISFFNECEWANLFLFIFVNSPLSPANSSIWGWPSDESPTKQNSCEETFISFFPCEQKSNIRTYSFYYGLIFPECSFYFPKMCWPCRLSVADFLLLDLFLKFFFNLSSYAHLILPELDVPLFLTHNSYCPRTCIFQWAWIIQWTSISITKIDKDGGWQFYVKIFTSITCKLMERLEKKGGFPLSISISINCFSQSAALSGVWRFFLSTDSSIQYG